MLNVHPSLLPRWRGAAPIERAIMAGDEVTGVSIMRLTAGLDSGPVCAQADEPIAATGHLRHAGRAAADARAASCWSRRSTTGRPCAEQDEALVTYAEKITAEDRVLDPQRPRGRARAGGARADAAHRRGRRAR